MNERIKELAEQAREKKFDYRAREGESHYIYVLNEEKFAELIVLEMCDVFDKRAEPGTGFYEPHEPAVMIREHFGIEK
jgi:hypothetical protein